MTAPSFLAFLERTLRIRSLTGPQRVFVRVVFDRIEPADLTGRDRDIAFRLFGAVDRFPPETRAVLALVKGARVGGTWLCSLYLLWRALVAELSGLAAGELAFAVIVAPDLRLARQALRFALGAAQACSELEHLVESSTSDSFIIRRPDGHRVAIEALPATRGGSALRGRTLVAALMDESSFFRDRESGVINDSELYRALVIRCTTPGAMLLVISTAWLESGVLHELVERQHGQPTTALACIAPTELMREGDARIAQIVAEERERDPENASREFDCQAFTGGAGIFFDAAAIRACIATDLPETLPPLDGIETAYVAIGAGIDPAFRSDCWAGCISRQNKLNFEVAEVFERRPSKGNPLVPGVVFAEFATVLRRHGVPSVVTDQAYVESTREHAIASSIDLIEAPAGQAGKLQVFASARDLIHAGRVRIPAAQRRLIQQLREVVSVPSPGGGIAIRQPRKGGSHGDIACAFVLSLWRAELRYRMPLSLRVFGSRGGLSLSGLQGKEARGHEYSREIPWKERDISALDAFSYSPDSLELRARLRTAGFRTIADVQRASLEDLTGAGCPDHMAQRAMWESIGKDQFGRKL